MFILKLINRSKALTPSNACATSFSHVGVDVSLHFIREVGNKQ